MYCRGGELPNSATHKGEGVFQRGHTCLDPGVLYVPGQGSLCGRANLYLTKLKRRDHQPRIVCPQDDHVPYLHPVTRPIWRPIHPSLLDVGGGSTPASYLSDPTQSIIVVPPTQASPVPTNRPTAPSVPTPTTMTAAALAPTPVPATLPPYIVAQAGLFAASRRQPTPTVGSGVIPTLPLPQVIT